MRKKLLPFLFIPFSLFACGPKPVDKNIQSLNSTGANISVQDFDKFCALMGGRLSSDKTICAKPFTKELPNGTGAGLVEIDPRFASGKYITSSGMPLNNSSVEIVLNSTHYAYINDRKLANDGPGVLSFFISGSNYANVSATIWTCYDRHADIVGCNDSAIP